MTTQTIGTHLRDVWDILYDTDPGTHPLINETRELLFPLVEYTGYSRTEDGTTTVRLVPDDGRFSQIEITIVPGWTRTVRELPPSITADAPEVEYPDPFA